MCHILFKLASSQFIIYNQVRMSIPNLIHKIKGNIDIDKSTFLYLFIIVGVGISSFGLGRLSISNSEVKNISITTEAGSLKENQSSNNNLASAIQPTPSGEKRYVASKNGKMYYSLGCSGAKRIKPANEVWFSTKEDAEKSGFTLSTTCK
jgi:hypothetical protein